MLICVFLRGGADGLQLVAPVGDPDYYRRRPSLHVPQPDGSDDDRGVDLDGMFALHAELAPLAAPFEGAELAIVHAVGSDDTTRSHFEAQDRMEQAGPAGHGVGSGWLARHLRSRAGPAPTNLTAVALGTDTPEALRGAPAVAVLTSIDDYELGGGDVALERSLGALYADEFDVRARTEAGALGGRLLAAGRDTLATVARLREIARADSSDRPSYPDDAFGAGLREIASLARADVGLEIATIDLDGWDTHFVQDELLPGRAQVLARGLSALRSDLDARLEQTTIVVMTEFGRRAYENSSLGTDHGRASCMMVLGGRVRGGRVYGGWPGLAESDLEEPGDLRVTTDYRDVLCEILTAEGATRHGDVFPGFSRGAPLGICRS